MEWREIEILNTIYLVSEYGDLKNKETNRPSRSLANQHGYHRYTFKRRKLGIQKKEAKHRLVAKAFVPNPNAYLEVNHIDGNKNNNHYSNLEWCTRSENIKHSFRIGLRTHKGEKNPMFGKKSVQITKTVVE